MKIVKQKKSIRKLLFVTFGLLFTIFTSCDKSEKIDYDKLEGTTWETKTKDVAFTLQFLDKSVCTIGTVRQDDTYSSNLMTYTWRYQSIHDSMWALCYLYSKDEEEGNSYYGRVENKKLYLYPFLYPLEGYTEVLCFERKK